VGVDDPELRRCQGGLDGLGEGTRLWVPVPAFAFTT
jgi:hypothetical protein